MTPPQPKIIHVVYRETLNQVLESQVLRPVARLAREETDLEVETVALTPLGLLLRRPWREKVLALKARAETGYGIHFRTPMGLPARLQNPGIDDRLLIRALRDSVDRSRRNILHCRGAFAARCALAVAAVYDNVEVVYDCRADDSAETVAGMGVDPDRPDSWGCEAREAWRQALRLEADVVSRADSVVAVSEALKQLLVDRHRIHAEKISVFPCAVDCDSFAPGCRQIAREELGLQEKFVVGYVGSANWYQCIDESLDLFCALRRRHPGAHFFAITTDRDIMHRSLLKRRVGEADFTLCSVSSAEVARLVPAMDAGLLIRRRSSVNAVASPVKFGEYLASGVPVITTPWVGDFSAAVDAFGLGAVCDLSESSEQVVADSIRRKHWNRELRADCRSFAVDHLSTQRQAEKFRRLYGLKEKPSGPARRCGVPIGVLSAAAV